VYLTDYLQEFPGRNALLQESGGPGFERALDFYVAFKGREYDDTGFGELGSDCGQRINAAQIRHTKVHEGDIGAMSTILLDRIPPTGRL